MQEQGVERHLSSTGPGHVAQRLRAQQETIQREHSALITAVAQDLYARFPIEDAGEAIDGFTVAPPGQLSWLAAAECDQLAPYYKAAQAALLLLEVI